MRRVIAPLVAAAALAGLAASAAATIVLRVSPRELADTANLVVEGRVAAVDVRWDDARTCINHYVTFSVERTHKGPTLGSVVIKVPGGRVGEEEVRVEGTAVFTEGEEAMVFLWKDGKGEWIVLGEAQGKFRLFQEEGKAARRMAENSLRGLCIVVRGDPKATDMETAKRPDTLPFDDLAAVVKASVDAAKKPAPGAGGSATGGAATGKGETTTGAPGATGEGRDPAPPVATPDPPSTKSTDGEAPPPTKVDPAPPAGKPVQNAGDGEKPVERRD